VPTLATLDIWGRYQTDILDVMALALSKLAQRADLPVQERALNRELALCIAEAVRELDPDSTRIIPIPVFEAEIQPWSPHEPDEDEPNRFGRTPDIQWIFRDAAADNALTMYRSFQVECKRLGESGRISWPLNQNYVNHGISRFEDPVAQYGANCRSGAMVGYIQNLDHAQVLTDVNAEMRVASLRDNLVLVSKKRAGAVSELSHALHRRQHPSPFRLVHLWVDLRGCCRSSGSPLKSSN
jgi:hypothetical protein